MPISIEDLADVESVDHIVLYLHGNVRNLPRNLNFVSMHNANGLHKTLLSGIWDVTCIDSNFSYVVNGEDLNPLCHFSKWANAYLKSVIG